MIWHELSRIRGGLAQYSTNNRAKQIVQRNEESPDIFEAHFERKESEGRTEYPHGWIQLWPIEPITAPTAQEARDKALSLLEIAAGKSQDELFEKRAFPVPLHQKKIEEVHSPTHRALAWIIKHDEKRFEVRYFGVMVDDEQEEEWRLSIPAVDGMPVREGYAMLTLASTLEDAERAAVLELETIVYTGEIKARHP